MNTSAKGTAAELRVAAYLQERGWLVGSRRHIGGAGDLVAVKVLERGMGHHVRLIEVKGGRRPFENFRPADRSALAKQATQAGAVGLLAWSPDAKTIKFIPPKDWP